MCRPQDDMILTPKKANWDLKRDIENKMALLTRRTDRAIAALRRELLQNDADATTNVSGTASATDGDDLVSKINAQSARDAHSDDDEDDDQ
jgi:coiled-coil domain-containing protein 12